MPETLTSSASWKGRHAVVTGASRGIGVAIAEELAARGARVTVVARSEVALKEVAVRIGGQPYPADLGDPSCLDGMIGRIERLHGPVDLLVNNAAVALVGNLTDHTAAEIHDSFAVNVVAPIELMRQAIPPMTARGRGSLACVSSLAGHASFPGCTVYGATKAGLMQGCTTLQRELQPGPVRLTLAVLGEIAGTDMMEVSREHPAVARFAARMNRLRVLPEVTPHDVALALVDAVERGRRTVVLPARAAGIHWLREAPSRLNDLLLRGIR